MKKIAFIGAGRMASAIVGGLINSGNARPADIACIGGDDDTAAKLAAAGINIHAAQAICSAEGRFGALLQLDEKQIKKAASSMLKAYKTSTPIPKTAFISIFSFIIIYRLKYLKAEARYRSE